VARRSALDPTTAGGQPPAPRWLDDAEQRAWRGLVAFVTAGLPRIERTFRAHGLVHLEYGMLAVLSEHDGGLRLNALAEVLGVSASRLTHRMAKLVDRGLVAQRPCPEDGRGAIATITPAGSELLARVAPEHVEDVRATFLDHLDACDVEVLGAALGEVAAGLGVGLAEAVGGRPGAGPSRATPGTDATTTPEPHAPTPMSTGDDPHASTSTSTSASTSTSTTTSTR
jgi:DNA-binding MarR family transcriptional regulator